MLPFEVIGAADDESFTAGLTAEIKLLKKVSSRGGPAITIGAMNLLQGACWGSDDSIIVSFNGARGLHRIAASGGEPQRLTTADAARGERSHNYPQLLPGGEDVLFAINAASRQSLGVLSLETGQWTAVLDGPGHAVYAATGHLVYGLEGSLWAVPFDLDPPGVTGRATPVLEGILTRPKVGAQFAIAANGALAYIAGQNPSRRARELVWVDRRGGEGPLSTPLRGYETARISPEGDRVALTLREESGTDSWIWSLSRGGLTRVADGWHPAWTPDGRWIAYTDPGGGVFRRVADGSGAAELLLEGAGLLQVRSFSPDADFLVLERELGELWAMALHSERSFRPLFESPGQRRNAEISPDGRFIAYESASSGRFEIYVRPFPDVASGRWQISTEGGVQPLWSRDGRELFYRGPDTLFAVRVDTEDGFRAGEQESLFVDSYYLGLTRGVAQLTARAYDVSPDGQRFLMIKGPHAAPSEPMDVVLVQNWLEELERLVPPRP